VETKANHVLIGLFTLGVVAALLLFVLWAAKYSSQSKFNEYDIVFNEAVTGLSIGGLVQYNGITVGSVRDLHLAPNDPRKVIARIRVNVQAPVKVDTKAKLGSSLLSGVGYIQLSGGTPASPLLVQTDHDHVPVIVAEESALQKLLNSTEDIATTVTDVLYRINNIISDKNTARIGKSLQNIQELTDSLAGERQDLAALIRNAKQASDRLDHTMANADKTFETINQSLNVKLPGMVKNLDQSLAQLNSFTGHADAFMKDNRGALNSFANQGLAQVGPTLTELRMTLRELTRLVSNLQKEPARFLLGRDQPQEFKPQ
jgi:phospholipid/cholesterol/gamma-HCH transport system substrate-binding protein